MLYRIRNFFIIAVMLILAYLIQYSVISNLSFLGTAPNLMLIITATYGYSRGKNAGMIIGFFSGLIVDVFFCEVIGYNALMLVTVGFLSALWRRKYYSDTLVIPLVIITLSDLGYNLVYYFVWFILRSQFYFGYSFVHIILPNLLLTFVFGLALYKPILFLNNKLYMHYETEQD